VLETNLSEGKITLAGELHIRFLAELKDVLWQALGTNQELEVDVSRVNDLDVAGLQLLLAFLRSRQASAPTKLVGTPPAFSRALELTGLKEHFASFMA